MEKALYPSSVWFHVSKRCPVKCLPCSWMAVSRPRSWRPIKKFIFFFLEDALPEFRQQPLTSSGSRARTSRWRRCDSIQRLARFLRGWRSKSRETFWRCSVTINALLLWIFPLTSVRSSLKRHFFLFFLPRGRLGVVSFNGRWIACGVDGSALLVVCLLLLPPSGKEH